jgi:hypothetical protein
MNYRKLLGLALSVIFFVASSSAQDNKTLVPRETDYNKPKLFSTLPDNIKLNIDSLGNIFSSPTGKQVNLGFGDKILPTTFAGKVISVASKYENKIQSIVVRSSNFNGATLTLSSTTMADGTIKYTGRIISFEHGDAYELQKKGDQYMFVKRNLYELVNE